METAFREAVSDTRDISTFLDFNSNMRAPVQRKELHESSCFCILLQVFACLKPDLPGFRLIRAKNRSKIIVFQVSALWNPDDSALFPVLNE
jgi:hypothetical protein